MTDLHVQVLSPEEISERSARWRRARDADGSLTRNDFELAEQAVRGTALFFWHDDTFSDFSWLCPGCGSWHYGQIGERPVSGWDAPRWVNSGTEEKPTLTPSLGCGGWRRGTCRGGHYWMRNGELVDA